MKPLYISIILQILFDTYSSYSVLPLELNTQEGKDKGIWFYKFNKHKLTVVTEDKDYNLIYPGNDNSASKLNEITIETNKSITGNKYLTVSYTHNNKDLKQFNKSYFDFNMRYLFFFLAVELEHTGLFNIDAFKVGSFVSTDSKRYEVYPDRLVMRKGMWEGDLTYLFEKLIEVDYSKCDVDRYVYKGAKEFLLQGAELTRDCRVTFRFVDKEIVVDGILDEGLILCFSKVNEIYGDLKVKVLYNNFRLCYILEMNDPTF
jgi:hypothetical protein